VIGQSNFALSEWLEIHHVRKCTLAWYIIADVYPQSATQQVCRVSSAIKKMTKQKVLLVGATGETGGHVLNGLLEDGNLVRLSNHIPYANSRLETSS
jgi:hypothetical protein